MADWPSAHASSHAQVAPGRPCVGKQFSMHKSKRKSFVFLLVPETSRVTSATPVRVDDGGVNGRSLPAGQRHSHSQPRTAIMLA